MKSQRGHTETKSQQETTSCLCPSTTQHSFQSLIDSSKPNPQCANPQGRVVGQCCGVELWGTAMGQCYRAVLQGSATGQRCRNQSQCRAPWARSSLLWDDTLRSSPPPLSPPPPPKQSTVSNLGSLEIIFHPGFQTKTKKEICFPERHGGVSALREREKSREKRVLLPHTRFQEK